MSKKGIMQPISNATLRNMALAVAVAFACGYGHAYTFGDPSALRANAQDASAAQSAPPSRQGKRSDLANGQTRS